MVKLPERERRERDHTRAGAKRQVNQSYLPSVLPIGKTGMQETHAEAFCSLDSRHDAGGAKVTCGSMVGNRRQGTREPERRSEHVYALSGLRVVDWHCGMGVW